MAAPKKVKRGRARGPFGSSESFKTRAGPKKYRRMSPGAVDILGRGAYLMSEGGEDTEKRDA